MSDQVIETVVLLPAAGFFVVMAILKATRWKG